MIFIRRISFATPEDERARLVSELKDLYAAQDFDRVLRRVESCLHEGTEGEKLDVVCDFLASLAESRRRSRAFSSGWKAASAQKSRRPSAILRSGPTTSPSSRTCWPSSRRTKGNSALILPGEASRMICTGSFKTRWGSLRLSSCGSKRPTG